MNDELKAALRQVLEEDVLPELRALSAALDRMSAQMEISHRSLDAKMDTMIQDVRAMREEMRVMREEMKALREENGPSMRPSLLIH